MTDPKRGVAPAAGYSGTPLPRKLGIKAGATVALLGAPDGFDATLGPLPDDVAVKRRAQGQADVIVLFAASARQLDARLPGALRALAAGGGLWLAWPKQDSGVATDLNQNRIREVGLATGLVDVKVCAIDRVWSGLQFRRRRQ